MKTVLAGAACALLIVVAQARVRVDGASDRPVAPAAVRQASDWSEWTRQGPGAEAAPQEALDPDAGIDVVDAHWMALTMWGEARRDGEEGLRAVGHVIHNRWLKARDGSYVTDTVSEAYQFSCWNPGDPNREAMLNIDALPQDGADYRAWSAAKRIAADILAGRSADPTGGALFYHSTAVQPAWSRGVAPVTRIGEHLFFRTAV